MPRRLVFFLATILFVALGITCIVIVVNTSKESDHLRRLRPMGVTAYPSFTHGMYEVHIDTDQYADDVFRLLSYCDEVESIRTTDLEVTDSHVRRLVALPKLWNLSIRGSSISDDAGIWFEKMDRLEMLDISKTDVGDDIIPYLAKCPLLRWVNLEDTRVSQDGYRHLVDSRPDIMVLVSKGDMNETSDLHSPAHE